ncbi:MAG: hypothetical protein IMW99_11565 [Firmicutes bacterium]|nr:hypothetical protein [Bacillota bacterium]
MLYQGRQRAARAALAAAILLGLLQAGLAGLPAGNARAQELKVRPLLDFSSFVFGGSAAWQPEWAEEWSWSAAAGWGLPTHRLHYRVGAARPLGDTGALNLYYLNWPSKLAGQSYQEGILAQAAVQPRPRDLLSLQGFAGSTVPDSGADGTPTGGGEALQVRYLQLGYKAQLWHSPGWDGKAVAVAVLGQTPADGGAFYSLNLAVPVQRGFWYLIPRAGYSQGADHLPGFQQYLGGYSTGWLRGYASSQFAGPALVNLTLEYRRPIPPLERTGIPVLSQLQAGAFYDAGAILSPGQRWSAAQWHQSYGLTLALPVIGSLVGADAAWNETGALRWNLRLSGEF